MIVFSGFEPDGIYPRNPQDTWVLKDATGSTPTWEHRTPSAPMGLPPGRLSLSAVYDTNSNRMIIFGGGQTGGWHYDPMFDDVWVLTNANGMGDSAWIPLSPSGGPPAVREGQGAFYDQATNEMYIFGGADNGIMSVPDDLWVLKNANGIGTPEWIPLSQTGQMPGRIEHFATAYDPATNRMTIVGGCCYYTNVSRVLDFNDPSGTPRWTTLSPGGATPPIGDAPFFGYDPSSNRLIVHGIQPGGGGNGTWVLTNANGLGGSPTWINSVAPGTPGTPPPGAYAIGSAYNAATKEFILALNKHDGSGNLTPEVWVLSNADCTSPPPQAPKIDNISTPIHPTFGVAGKTIVTLAGANFGAVQGSNTVKFGPVTAKVTDTVSWTDTEIRLRVPTAGEEGEGVLPAGILRVMVTTAEGTSNAVAFVAGDLSQGYAAFNNSGLSNHMYHSGIDLSGIEGQTPVAASEPGIVKDVFGLKASGTCKTTLIPTWDDVNGNRVVDEDELMEDLLCAPDLPPLERDYDNHDYGVTVVIQGETTGFWTQFAHLRAVKKQLWDDFSNGRTHSVAAGDLIGVVGRSTKGTPSGKFGPHLHLEVKEKHRVGHTGSPNTDVGADPKKPSEYWGYTPDLPRAYGYVDPFTYAYGLSGVVPEPTPLRVVREEAGSSVANRGIRIYAGPGVNYSVLGWTGLGQVLVADGTAMSTTPADVTSGRLWYRIPLPNRLGASHGFIAAAKVDGTAYVETEASATVAQVDDTTGEGKKLRLKEGKDCPGRESLACVWVWDNVYEPHRHVRAWNGSSFAVFATQTIAGVDWYGVYVPKIHFENAKAQPDATTYLDNVVGEIGQAWLHGDEVKIVP